MSDDAPVKSNGIAADQLRALVERIERLVAEKQGIADDIKEVFAEAKGAGFDTKILRQVLKLRNADAGEVAEANAVLALYCEALGMQMSLPL